jgi:outer membrane protein TolC
MEEVDTALSAYEIEDHALAAVRDASTQTQRLEKLADAQRSAGSIGRQTVLEARLASQSAELNRLIHEHARQQAVVDVARVLAL